MVGMNKFDPGSIRAPKSPEHAGFYDIKISKIQVVGHFGDIQAKTWVDRPRSGHIRTL